MKPDSFLTGILQEFLKNSCALFEIPTGKVGKYQIKGADVRSILMFFKFSDRKVVDGIGSKFLFGKAAGFPYSRVPNRRLSVKKGKKSKNE